MGRREVVIRLLQAGAPLNKRNCKDQLATELCADSGTYDAIRAFQQHMAQTPNAPWRFGGNLSQDDDTVGGRLQYEPFFVPRQPVIRAQQYKKEFQKIGMVMFNRAPGHGLGFLVASGVTRDYPVDMSTFLRRGKVDIGKVGSFLGEAYSLSHTIRLEFINSVVLQNTDVVGALVQVGKLMQFPDDLQKINRIVHGVARIWWRQHERYAKEIGKEASGNNTDVGVPSPSNQLATGGCSSELSGLNLKAYLESSDSLHQLMFSAVLLHWYIYKDGTGPRRDMDYTTWKKLNVGIEANGADMPDVVQMQVHANICQGFIPELGVASPGVVRSSASMHGPAHAGVSSAGGGGGADEGGGHGPAEEKPKRSLLAPSSAIEGWTQIVGGGFPRPTGLPGAETVSYQHMSNIFSEVTASSSSTAPVPGVSASAFGNLGSSAVPGRGGVEAFPSTGPRRDDFTWLSLCYTLLFFSPSPSQGAPYAFIELQRTVVHNVQPAARSLTLVGAPERDDLDDDLAKRSPGLTSDAPGSPTTGARVHNPVSIVLLLPDGRWQELAIEKLELRLPSVNELNQWSTHLIAACQGGSSSRPKQVPSDEGQLADSGPRGPRASEGIPPM
jgi:hypothetical protein